MKHLTLIVHTEVQQKLTDHLRGLQQVHGYSFSHVEGHGLEVDNDAYLSARDKVVGHTPRLRVDILLNDDDVDSVLETLRQSLKDIHDKSIYWVTAVESSGRL